MQVRQGVLESIAAHARRDDPRECCGLLIGTGTEVAEVVATANVALDPQRRYEIDPAAHCAEIRRWRDLPQVGGVRWGVVGAYHSHPRSEAMPSPTDLEQAFEEFLYLIAGPVVAEGRIEIRGYRLRSGAFEEVALAGTRKAE